MGAVEACESPIGRTVGLQGPWGAGGPVLWLGSWWQSITGGVMGGLEPWT